MAPAAGEPRLERPTAMAVLTDLFEQVCASFGKTPPDGSTRRGSEVTQSGAMSASPPVPVENRTPPDSASAVTNNTP